MITPSKPASALINDLSGFPALVELVSAILAIWPEHERYLKTNFAERDENLMRFSEDIAQIVCAIAVGKPGGLNQLALDYRFLCQKIVLPEELYFRRHERYRLEKFEDALETVYSNTPFMTRYMDGLLVSDVIWINHCRCMMHYTQTFLPGLNDNAAVLEIGPGHGLLLHLSDGHEHLDSMAAWDISDASLASAAHTLKTLGTARDVTFEKRNIFDTDILSDAHANSFDGVVLSEVLEHLERPGDAIDVLYHICKPEGQIWINVPANSPAPDHLYLVNEISEVVALVRKSGFEIVETLALPTSGTTLEDAVKKKLTVNCIVVGKKPA